MKLFIYTLYVGVQFKEVSFCILTILSVYLFDFSKYEYLLTQSYILVFAHQVEGCLVTEFILHISVSPRTQLRTCA